MEMGQLTWKDVESLPKNTIFFLTIGPMEAHGPHLPISTDFLIAKEVEKRVMEILKNKEINCIALPSLPIGVCKYLKNFAGTFSVEWKSLYKILLKILEQLSEHDFKYVIICNFHMDPLHIKAIHKAIKKAENFGIVACEPLSIYYYRGELFEKLEGEIHADVKETSLALYLFPEMVKNYKIKEFIIKVGLLDALKNFKELGAIDAYIGSPAKSNAEYGEKLFKKLVEKCLEAIYMLLEGKKPELPKKLKILLRI